MNGTASDTHMNGDSRGNGFDFTPYNPRAPRTHDENLTELGTVKRNFDQQWEANILSDKEYSSSVCGKTLDTGYRATDCKRHISEVAGELDNLRDQAKDRAQTEAARAENLTTPSTAEERKSAAEQARDQADRLENVANGAIIAEDDARAADEAAWESVDRAFEFARNTAEYSDQLSGGFKELADMVISLLG